jgi:hypothetical protein
MSFDENSSSRLTAFENSHALSSTFGLVEIATLVLTCTKGVSSAGKFEVISHIATYHAHMRGLLLGWTFYCRRRMGREMNRSEKDVAW